MVQVIAWNLKSSNLLRRMISFWLGFQNMPETGPSYAWFLHIRMIIFGAVVCGFTDNLWSPCRRKIPVTRGKKRNLGRRRPMFSRFGRLCSNTLWSSSEENERRIGRVVSMYQWVIYLLQLKVCAKVFIFHFLMSRPCGSLEQWSAVQRRTGPFLL